MHEYGAASIFGIIIVVLFLAPHGASMPGIPVVAAGKLADEFREGSMLFGGDIMLGRAVERLMERTSASHPFEGISNLTSSVDVAVGNFEAAVPKEHIPTENNSLTLSVHKDAVLPLHEHGFDVLSLANNHSYDFGKSGLVHTRETCTEYDLMCIGDPNRITDVSSAVWTVGTTRVGILAVHAVSKNPDEEALRAAVATLEEISDMQVAYVHWGEEYTDTHNKTQETLAHLLIDMGVDAIFGHHPHVVQNIALYKGKPIFYSLGNLIFDQYDSVATETGLLVRMDIEKDATSYTLIPVSSVETESQPHLMDVDARDAFVDALLVRSEDVEEHIHGATLIMDRSEVSS